MKKFRFPAAFAAGSLMAATGMMAMAPNAQGSLTTRCVGEGGDVTVPGDLVVPAGETCWLDGTIVHGKVQVRKKADLVVSDGTVSGEVHAAKGAYVDITDTKLGGNVVSDNAYGTYMDNSTVTGAVDARNSGNDNDGFVYAMDSRVAKRLHAEVPGEVVVERSHVTGPVTGVGTEYTDVTDSTLDHKLSVTNNAKGGTLCDSEVYGETSYSGNKYATQIGGDGPVTSCDGVSFFGGNVTVSDNNGKVRVSDTIMRGDLSGDNNDPAPRGENNRVRGTRSGQFKDLKTLSGNNKTSPRTLDQNETQQRDTTVKEKADHRRAHGKTQAHKAGKVHF